jgi:hypothetical protein
MNPRKLWLDPSRRHEEESPMPTGVYDRKPMTDQHRANLSAAMKGNTNLPNRRGSKWKPEQVAAVSGENGNNWKGETAGYNAVHAWLRKWYPKRGVCEDCGTEGKTDYAYLGEPGGFERDRSRYRELCRRCHLISEGRAA